MKKLDILRVKLVVCVVRPLLAEIWRGTVAGKSSALTNTVRVVEA